MNEQRVRLILARIMVWGVVLAAGVMLVGGVMYGIKHDGGRPADTTFSGEPSRLRGPVDIVEGVIAGHDASLIQVGVLLLLLNPLVRVAFAAVGYASSRNWMYAGFSAVVFTVLVVSFFV